MLLGVIADDFTGASDIANTLASEGMRTRLFIGVDAIAGGACDAGVVALKSRSIPANDAVTMSLEVLARLRAAGCHQFFFKYCSTFDSTPKGNIGPVAEALAKALDARGVIVCPAFPGAGRTVYQGHLFVGDRLLSESGMEKHPLTPMTDSDLRRWLALQCSEAPGHVAHAVVASGSIAIASALADAAARLVIVDALNNEDLRAIGAAAAGVPLVTGGSGIAIGLPANFRRVGQLTDDTSAFCANEGPALVISGSCSTATQGQVARHRQRAPALEVDLEALLAGDDVLAIAEGFVRDHRDDLPLVYSTASSEAVREAQQHHGAELTAGAVEAFFGKLAVRAVAAGFGRLVVAGGETSGAVVTALGLDAFDLGPEIDPGVPAMSCGGLALALKSGNFGGPGFFEKAVKALANE